MSEISTSADQPASNWWHLPALAIVFGLTGLAAATMLLLRGVEPFATWYYNFAWYPVLLAADGIVALTGGVRGKPSARHALSQLTRLRATTSPDGPSGADSEPS